MRVLITGTAGFIGFHLARRLLADGCDVTGIDGMTDYYDVRLKKARHAILKAESRFTECLLMLEDMPGLTQAAKAAEPAVIVHLAAQAGVRYSLENPRAYLDSNLTGTFNVLEIAREMHLGHLLIASTSSIYGDNTSMPFRETDRADHPITFYAATKKSTELMSHAYSHLWGVPTTALRFFTVYGPWGRPDMALFKFVEAISEDRPVEVYNHGDMARDFTYVDDIVEAVVRLVRAIPERGRPAPGADDSLSPVAPWRAVNVGCGAPVQLTAFIDEIERVMGRKARRELMPMQPGDVVATFADWRLLEALTGYRPSTSIAEGVGAFWSWYQEFCPREPQ
ncbi:MAG TPA: NAD-dependent epimerase/dehydratase family protein [Caulobacteraceae bacterium]